MSSFETFNPSVLDASKKEKEKFILQQIKADTNTTQEEKEKYFLEKVCIVNWIPVSEYNEYERNVTCGHTLEIKNSLQGE